MIFRDVRQGRPYPEHGLSAKDWAQIPPQQVRLEDLVTTTTVLELDRLLADDSTFFGDLFPHAVQWSGELYLEDGLHRALRAALQQRIVLHVRVLDLDVLRGDPDRQPEPASRRSDPAAAAARGDSREGAPSE